MNKVNKLTVLGRAVGGRASAAGIGLTTQRRLLQPAVSGLNSASKLQRFPHKLAGHFPLPALAVSGTMLLSGLAQDVSAEDPVHPKKFLPNDVVLYQYEACPFCNKVKAFLDYYDIGYKVVEVNPINKKEIKWSEYKKMFVGATSELHHSPPKITLHIVPSISPVTMITRDSPRCRALPCEERIPGIIGTRPWFKKWHQGHWGTRVMIRVLHDHGCLAVFSVNMVLRAAFFTFSSLNPFCQLGRTELHCRPSLNPSSTNLSAGNKLFHGFVLNIINKLFQRIHPEKYLDSVPDGDEERKWLGWVDNHLVHVLSPNIYRSASEAIESFDYITTHGNFSFTERIIAKYGGAAAMYFVSKKLKKRHNITDERAALYGAAETWVDALKGRKFLGGLEPNLADLTVFGVLRPIRHLKSGRDMVEHTGIGEWYSRMEAAVGESSRIKLCVSMLCSNSEHLTMLPCLEFGAAASRWSAML
ncbi:Prostaglandin E synthase 2 [Vitis vinifera]|uniref:Prostaglandin E synthase 2 n=1 Tax=Vitis vinifera TaxID=29760 RepID=A0A438J2Z9_VITVI|nr:Prostaglandin E synthase 2 [Vitis vinifera]